MASKVILFQSAKDELSALPREVMYQVARAIDDLEMFPEKRIGIKKLKPPFDGFRKRVRDHRILFDFEGGVVFVRHIRDRKDAYR